LARNADFQQLTVFIVVLNAIYIGVDADWNSAQNIYDADWGFLACSQIFCFYFTFEWLVRLLAFKNKSDSMRDGWFRFDTFLVVTMVLDTWVIMAVMKLVQSGKEPANIPVQPLRVLRLLKLSRMARLMRVFPELVMMLKGLLRSLRAISSSLILVSLMVYTWAILIHSMMKDEEELNDSFRDEYLLDFSTVTRCMWALFIDGT